MAKIFTVKRPGFGSPFGPFIPVEFIGLPLRNALEMRGGYYGHRGSRRCKGPAKAQLVAHLSHPARWPGGRRARRPAAGAFNDANTSRFNGPARFGSGRSAATSIGWGFGNGVHLELEADWHNNQLHGIAGADGAAGNEYKYGVMGNALYDFDAHLPITPYIGAGVGWQIVGIDSGEIYGPGYFVRLDHPQSQFAYQAIVGSAWHLPLPGASVTLEYRFLGVMGSRQIYGQYFSGSLAAPANVTFRGDYNQVVMLGFRYEFEGPR